MVSCAYDELLLFVRVLLDSLLVIVVGGGGCVGVASVSSASAEEQQDAEGGGELLGARGVLDASAPISTTRLIR